VQQNSSVHEELDFKEFVDDERTIDAVIRNFEILGEAAKQVPAELRPIHPNIPWKQMIQMRDLFVHEYFGVDHEILWETIREDIPKLAGQLKLLKSYRPKR
jgi:hypothetical protein